MLKTSKGLYLNKGNQNYLKNFLSKLGKNSKKNEKKEQTSGQNLLTRCQNKGNGLMSECHDYTANEKRFKK